MLTVVPPRDLPCRAIYELRLPRRRLGPHAVFGFPSARQANPDQLEVACSVS
ncbi:MAG: hypothetical protein QOI16_1164 [Pseudonocardiales bacterium]|nr:hypothetical protein [Pseudonocardiales bacterium]